MIKKMNITRWRSRKDQNQQQHKSVGERSKKDVCRALYTREKSRGNNVVQEKMVRTEAEKDARSLS